MAKSWLWRHAISIWLHFHRVHSSQMNDCGRWTKKSFDLAAERSINRPQIRKYCTWGPSEATVLHSSPLEWTWIYAHLHWPFVSGSLWGPLTRRHQRRNERGWASVTPSLVHFFFPLLPCHFRVNYSIRIPNRNVRFLLSFFLSKENIWLGFGCVTMTSLGIRCHGNCSPVAPGPMASSDDRSFD